MKKKKSTAKYCTICGGPLFGDVQKEYGLCGDCLYKQNKSSKETIKKPDPKPVKTIPVKKTFKGPIDVPVTFRMQESMYTSMNSRIKELGLSQSEYIRRLIQGDLASL